MRLVMVGDGAIVDGQRRYSMRPAWAHAAVHSAHAAPRRRRGHMRGLDLFVLTSLTWDLKAVLDAMASGMPVVATAVTAAI